MENYNQKGYSTDEVIEVVASPLEENRNMALLTEEVQEVISYRPHWIVRKGNIVFLFIILLLLALTWIIKYPDIINSGARLVSLNPPKLINAKTQGKILKLFVINEQAVKKGQHLGYMESTADYAHVIKLYQWIDTIIKATANKSYECLINNPLPALIQLGELQIPYQQFQNQLEIEKQTLQGGYYQRKKSTLEKDLVYLLSLKNNSEQQKHLQVQDQQLQQKEYIAYESLAKDKVIAPMELNQYKSKLIIKEQSLKQLNAQITGTEISSLGKQKEILEIQKQMADQQQQFHSSLLQLKSEVEKWMQQYVLVAPEGGKILFVSTLQENEWVENGQSLFYVQPPQSTFYSEIMAGQKGVGKIKVGQKVMIRIDGYPSDEFGYLTARINYIAGTPGSNDSFLIKAELLLGLQTSYRKNIFFRNGLMGQAEIITDDRKLFHRLTGQLKEIWER